jgi:hypothetical protein
VRGCVSKKLRQATRQEQHDVSRSRVLNHATLLLSRCNLPKTLRMQKGDLAGVHPFLTDRSV